MISRITSALLLLFANQVALGAPLPANFTAHYTVSKGSFTLGEMRRSLSSNSDGSFLFESFTQPTGLLANFYKDKLLERSLWAYEDSQVRPLQYSYRQIGGKKERHRKQVFDWKSDIVRIATEGSTLQLPLAPGTQDKLSYQLAMMADLEQGQTELEYPFIDKKRLKTYRFRVVSEEKLSTPLGSLQTVKLKRIQDSDERTTIVWCASSLNYLPVRIEQHAEDEGSFSMVIKSVEGLAGSKAQINHRTGVAAR